MQLSTGQTKQNKTQGSSPRRKSTRVRSVRPLADAALKVAASANKRVKGREATVRYAFLRLPRDSDPGADPAPVARLLRGSRDGLRLKLYLALLWMAGGGEENRHEVTFPARAFAELLDLPNPDTAGQRRVREALKSFEEQRLTTIRSDPGRPLTITLLCENGSGEPYERPGKYWQDRVEDEEDPDLTRMFVRLGNEFWVQGWALELSAPAVAMLLVMLLITRNGRNDNQWVAMSERRFYGLSDDTWTRGIAELVDHGILIVRKLPVNEDAFQWKRVRSHYTLRMSRLSERADPPLPGRDDSEGPRPPKRAARRRKRASPSA
jgi:hypothetical protein